NDTGVGIFPGSSNILVAGNYIGTDVSGTAPVGNSAVGVMLDIGTSNTRIGDGTTLGTNVISGNGSGIGVNPAGAGNSIKGHFSGTHKTGQMAVGNQTGMPVYNRRAPVTIGANAVGSGNVISGNVADGVDVLGGTTTFGGNFIGLGSDGNTKVGNGGVGVKLASNGNTIGAGNVISGNSSSGVLITGSNNQITGSFIGTNHDGNAAVPNALGVEIKGSNNTLTGNVISGNTGDGVVIS